MEAWMPIQYGFVPPPPDPFFTRGMLGSGCRYWIKEVNSSLGKYAWGVSKNGTGIGGWTDTVEDAKAAVQKEIARRDEEDAQQKGQPHDSV
jgi:hypothetical protein